MGRLREIPQDVWFALRTGTRRWRFNGIAAITIALGVGATTAIYSVAQAVLFDQLPYDEAGRIVQGHTRVGINGLDRLPSSWPVYTFLREAPGPFESVAAYTRDERRTVEGSSSSELVRSGRASATLLPTLGVQPVLGRNFTEEEDGAAGDPVVLVSHRLWRDAFGEDPSLVGRSLNMDGRPFTVIGVLPPDFRLPGNFGTSRRADLLEPFGVELTTRGPIGGLNLEVVARLRSDGPTLADAQAGFRDAFQREKDMFGNTADWEASARFLEEVVLGSTRGPLALLFGAVSLVLLISCVNIANLLIAQGEARLPELRTRRALGAGRGRITRQLLTEAVLLGIVGGALGLALATGAIDVFRTLDPATLPRADAIRVDARVFAFAAGLSLLSGIAFGLVPAMRSAGALTPDGRGRAVTSATRRWSLPDTLIAAQITLASVLAFGAGLMSRTLSELHARDTGVRQTDVIHIEARLPPDSYQERADIEAFFGAARLRMERAPGVARVAVTGRPPVGGGDVTFRIEGEPNETEFLRNAQFVYVSPEYLETTGLELRAGRWLRDQDGDTTISNVVVNERFARLWGRDGDVIGQRLLYAQRAWEVVGVIEDTRNMGVAQDPRPEIFHSAVHGIRTGFAGRDLGFVVRTTADPMPAVPALRAAVHEIDEGVPLGRVTLLQDVFRSTHARQALLARLLTSFAVMALALATVGVAGVLTHYVARHRRDVSIRMALGATRRNVIQNMLRRVIPAVAVGMVLGVPAALATARLLEAHLVGVGSLDAVTLVVALIAVCTASVMASVVPALQASATAPGEILG